MEDMSKRYRYLIVEFTNKRRNKIRNIYGTYCMKDIWEIEREYNINYKITIDLKHEGDIERINKRVDKLYDDKKNQKINQEIKKRKRKTKRILFRI